MKTRPFGPVGVEVPILGQGTWQLRDHAAAARAVLVGLELGMTHVDTAEIYKGSEETLAPVISRFGREKIFLVSKVWPRNATAHGAPRACDASLRRLGTDHLDVYLMHWPSDATPLEETMTALGGLVDAKKTRAVGVSNFDAGLLDEARSALGKHAVACDQVLYHLGARGAERELIPYCEKHRVALVAYSPFGSGRFPPGGKKGLAVLETIAARHKATPHQVALNFLATVSPSVFVIPKAETEAHVRANAAALDFTLSARDREEIDAAFPVPKSGELETA
ncbi:MAG: aldo/keto reductase [Thermoplasmatota archaeon]